MKEKAIQLLFEAAVEGGIQRNTFRTMKEAMQIIDPNYDLGPVDKYYNEQMGGQSDNVAQS